MDYRNISKTVYKVNDFLSWQKSGSLLLSPSFQRRPVWHKSAKSYLIDTVVRGLPIPIIFLREHTDLSTLEPKREVVDGQQRLRTLFSFIEPTSLRDYKKDRDDFLVMKSHNQDLAGKPFAHIDPKIKQRILNYDFSVHVLPSDTEDREVLQIFARMNSTGVKLNYQELRNAKCFGIFKRLAYTLAYEQLNRWREWNIFSENDIARMIEVEITSDLIRMILEGLQGMSQPGLDRLYDKYEDEFVHENIVAYRFRLVMESLDGTVGNNLANMAFRRKALFHTLFTFFYDLMFGIKSPLKPTKPNVLPRKTSKVIHEASEKIKSHKLPEDLLKVLRGATGNLQSRNIRLTFLREVYNSVEA